MFLLLSLSNVSVSYGGPDVVKNVSLSLPPNHNLAIIGPNGCGKTTLLKAIANLLPYKGSIDIDGSPLRLLNHRQISRKIALLSQISSIYFSYSVFDTVMMGRYLHIKDKFLGLPSDFDKQCVIDSLNAVGLLPQKDCEITKLSGGQLQRVFLARTLAQQPDIILLDEPTNHLDLKFQIELIDYLKLWTRSHNRSVIGVLHDINLAMRLSDNIMLMKDGISLAIGNVNDVISSNILKSVYDIDVVQYMRDSLSIWSSTHFDYS